MTKKLGSTLLLEGAQESTQLLWMAFRWCPSELGTLLKSTKRNVAMQLDLDKKLASDISKVINPTPLKNILEWATACGVAPEELTEGALL